MNPQMEKGLGLAKTGLRAAKGGQKALRWVGKLRKLPPLRQKAEEKARAKATRKEAKRQRRKDARLRCVRRLRILRRDAKGLGSVLLALQRRYF